MKLTHIGISQFRSIGPEPVMIDLTKRITVLVGQNDCGKSNVLRGMERVSKLRKLERPSNLGWLDDHKRSQDGDTFVHFKVKIDEAEQTLLSTLQNITITAPLGEEGSYDDYTSSELLLLGDDAINNLIKSYGPSKLGPTSKPKSQQTHDLALLSCRIIEDVSDEIPSVTTIPQFRRIEVDDKYSVGGKGITNLLAQWQHPEIGKDHLKLKFNQVVRFLSDLLDWPNVVLEVPPSQEEIIVSDGTMRLPLESHGTGVHQLIILAIAVLSEDNVIFGIEEPEIHLHPVLQRRFVQFLLRETTNRYIITTHSAALISPSDEVDVIHLKMVDGVTIPTRVDTDANALAVLDDLGVRASDLLQANSVIWVEGPSDRIYLNQWLELVEPTLREGVDYAIMFYGGRLLSHLSLDREDAEVNGFIKMLRINQRSAILMDSDRDNAVDSINETKQRIQIECAKNHLHAWLTDGREIENYLSEACVNASLIEHGAKEASISIEPFEKFYSRMQKACGKSFKPSWAYENHKPAWAHRFVKHMTRDQIKGDLDTQLSELIAFIKPR